MTVEISIWLLYRTDLNLLRRSVNISIHETVIKIGRDILFLLSSAHCTVYSSET